jgi:hypothetical protein
MGLLAKLFNRPDREPTTALAVSSRQTTNLTRVDLRRGVVTLRSGEARCFLRITGFTAHHRDEAAALEWLQGYARALNTLPGNAVLIARSRPGGLDDHVRVLRSTATSLARSRHDFAGLAQDQLRHAVSTHSMGRTRQTDQYVALYSPKGDATRLLAAAAAVTGHLTAAGVAVEPVTDRDLARTLAEDWRPEQPAGFVQEILFPQDSNTVLADLEYAPRHSHVAPRSVR